MLIDLHMHTNYSDGSFSPEELIDYVSARDVGIIAVTDHDEIGGVLPAREYGEKKRVDVIPGVELSIDMELTGGAHLHMLGLLFDPENVTLIEELNKLKKAREERAFRIVQKLREAGIPIDADDLIDAVGQGSAGRPHIAAILIKKGVVSDIYEAFDKYLSKGRPGYVPKTKLKLEPAIELIHRAGGLAIIAHPVSLKYETYRELGEKILEMKAVGLDGIEAYYPGHDKYLTEWLVKFAGKNNLVVSGGSDFHGSAKPDVEPGIGRGGLVIPPEIVERLREEVREVRSRK
ncbi:MAG: PHP domain-containing protein [Calditrichaceae bacterium]